MAAAAEKWLYNGFRALGSVATVGMIGTNCIFNVEGGEQAVMINRFGTPFNAKGISEKMYNEGTHFKMPWFQKEEVYTIRTRAKDIPTTTPTKDLQTVTIWIRLLYKPDRERLFQIHKTLGNSYDERVLPSVGNEVMKSVVAQYDADHLLTQRDKVSREIRNQVTERCLAYDIVLDDVSITHLAFSKEYAKAIEDKQVAEQDAEKQKYVVARAEQERLATVVRAEGEAEAATMISTALKTHGGGMIEVKRIDAAREIAETLSKANNVMYLPGGGSNMLLNLGVPGGSAQR
jgi:prohibitin 1